ncbi:lecithin retinol acyltransferase family protein [Pseudomonas sp.]|uniref:lecithin retinol acyltransferase family protein n=1 Tax=Pseudomonas sp. TaxID=306 RepID=UPI003F36EC53
MKGLSAKVVDSVSSLRSTVLVCLTLMAASVFSQLNTHPFAESRKGTAKPTRHCDCPLQWVNLEQAADTLPVGAHLMSPRRFYMHHGIYLGGGNVAHYSGFSSSFRPGPIEVIDLERFANGKTVWMYPQQCEYASHEIANRARSRVGENQYRILSNNCEHFCSWCISGKSYSAQVDAYLRCPRSLFSFISALEQHFIA